MTIDCKSCFKKIDSRAKRCVHCGATWGWFHWASVISAVAGLLLTLISLMTIAYSGAKKISEEEKGELIGEFITVRKDGIHFTVTNIGNRAVTLYDVWVEYPFTTDACKAPPTMGSREIDKGIIKVINAKKTEALVSHDSGLYAIIPSSVVPEFRADREKYDALEKKCSIHLSYIDYDQITRQKLIKFPCLPQGRCMDDFFNKKDQAH